MAELVFAIPDSIAFSSSLNSSILQHEKKACPFEKFFLASGNTKPVICSTSLFKESVDYGGELATPTKGILHSLTVRDCRLSQRDRIKDCQCCEEIV